MKDWKKIEKRTDERMIQDIGKKRLMNQYQPKVPADTDVVMIFHGRMIYAKNDGKKLLFLTYGEVMEISREKGFSLNECIYLFQIGELSCFLLDCDEIQAEGFQYYKMRELRRMTPKEAVFAAATAWHLYVWYTSNQFCGVCGEKTLHDKRERMLRCNKCGNMIYPRLVPAVIVGLTDGDKMLVTKYAGREHKRYALIAGFAEIGETLEETVAREVREEVGLRVKNITYYKSQPWGFESDLLMGFYCELDGDGTIVMDEQELAVAEWVDYQDMPRYKEGLSLTEEMMNHFCENRKKK